MAALLAMMYGAYLVAVAVQGNSIEFIKLVESEAGYVIWVIAIAIFVGLNSIPLTQPVAGPLLGLTILTFLVMNIKTISANASAFYSWATVNNTTLASSASTGGIPSLQSFNSAPNSLSQTAKGL